MRHEHDHHRARTDDQALNHTPARMRRPDKGMTMTPEEQAAADAAAAAAKAAAEADAGKDAAYWQAEAKKAIADRDAAKAKVKELTPAAQRLKEIEDASKTETQRLADENAGLKTKAARAEALETQVQAIFDESTKDLTAAQLAAIVGDTPEAKLAHLRTLQAAGMLGEPYPGRSPGADLPGRGGAGATKQSAVAAMSHSQRQAFYAEVAAGKRSVVPG